MNLALTRTPAEEVYGGMMLPHPRIEEWKWTNLRTLIDRPYPPRQFVKANTRDIERLIKASPFAKVTAARMVFVNGRYEPLYSKLENGTLAARATLDEPVIAMNAAFADDGAKLSLSGPVDMAIELVFIASEGADRTIATRNVVEIAAGASVTLIETYLGEGGYLSNAVTEIRLGEGARLDRVKVEHESAAAIHLSHAHVTLAKNARLNDFTLTSGARVNRQNGTYVFEGVGAEARVSGAYLLSGRQHADTRLVVDHRVPHCLSRELFKCVMDEHARGIFQGKVIVRPDAQKTDGKQSSHALLLSETAEFDAKPELEIFADDVVCGHGATCGDLDHDHLFYLKSRGIPEQQARAMLVEAFVAEAVDTVENEAIREALLSLVHRRFA